MHIVDVCAFYSPNGGGVKTYIHQKLAVGPQLGHEITIIAPTPEPALIEFGPKARILGLPSPRFPLDRNYCYFDDEPALHAALDAAKPDIVEVSSPWRSPSFVARWNGAVPRSLFMHADPLSAYAYRWLEPLWKQELIDRQFDAYWRHLRRLGMHYDTIICPNAKLRERLAGGGVANTRTLPLGIDTGLFTPAMRDNRLRARMLAHCNLPETGHLLIGAGRLSAEKRWPMVVDAVAAAGNELPVGLMLYGAGSEEAKIRRAIQGNPHIRLMGTETNRHNFAAFMASADALIHGCEAETFCMAAAEARASGIAVIGPDKGGAADHARHGGQSYVSGNALSASRAILRHFRRPSANGNSDVLSIEGHFRQLFDHYAGLRHPVRKTG